MAPVVEQIEPGEAESLVDNLGHDGVGVCWAARRVNFQDGDTVVAIIYGAGPTAHIRQVEHAIDALGCAARKEAE